MRRRPVSIILLGLLVGLLLSGCGSDEPSPQQVVAGSVAATTGAGTAKVHEVVKAKGGAANGTYTADGAIDFESRQATMTAEIAGQPLDLILDGTDIYERADVFEAETGKPWIHVDLDEMGKRAGVEGLGSVMQGSSNDPGAMLQYLRGAGEVTERGTARVRGVSTTHYHAVIDYRKAARSAPAATAKALRQLADLMGSDEQPLDVWIDADGRTRRLVQPIDYSKAHLPKGIDRSQVPDSMEMTVDYFDFGTKVEVDIPDAADVAELSDLLGDQATPVVPTPEHVALERSLLTDVPAGFEQQADDVGDTGPSDLAKAVRDAGEDDAEKVLTDAGFVAGYQRLWVNGDDDSELIVFLYEFETPAGAAKYGVHYRDVGTEPYAGTTTSAFSVDGVPGAIGTHYTSDKGEAANIVDFTAGTYVVRVVANGPSSNPELAVALARQQLQRLSQ